MTLFNGTYPSRSRKKAPQHSFDRYYEATRPQKGESLYEWATTDYFKMNSPNEINPKLKINHNLLVPPIIEQFMDTAAVADYDCMRCSDINRTRLHGEPKIPCIVSGVDDRCALCIVTKQKKSICRSQLPRNYFFKDPLDGKIGQNGQGRENLSFSPSTSLSSRLLSPETSKRQSSSPEERDSKRTRYHDRSSTSFDRSLDGISKRSDRSYSADLSTAFKVENGGNGVERLTNPFSLGPKEDDRSRHQDLARASSPKFDTNGSSKSTSDCSFFSQEAIDAMGPYGSFFEKLNKDFKVKEIKIIDLERKVKEEKQKALQFELSFKEEEKKTEQLRKSEGELQTKLSIEQDIFRHIGAGIDNPETEQMKMENQRLRARIILLEDKIKNLFTTTMASTDDLEG